MERDEIFLKLKEILNNLGVEKVKITENTALLNDKLMDSMDFMNYITTVEEEFGVELSDDDVSSKKLGIIKNMVDFLNKNIC